MPDNRSSRRDYSYEEGIRREPQRRPANGRPPQNRRPVKRRRRATPRLFVFAAILLAIVILLVVLLTGRGGSEGGAQPIATPTPAPQTGALTNATISSSAPDATQAESTQSAGIDVASASGGQYSTLSQWLGDEDAELEPLPEEQRVKVDDLSINTSLPEEWLNILLMGSDERTLSESSRTDTMIICSINQTTKEVKLTSIMRDTAVKYDDLGEHNGTYRINAANYFGGPEFAMKTVNECFGMNIQYYVTVNFFGFQKIAEALGGIDVDISEAEMNEINNKLYEQYKIAKKIGEAAPTVENDLMTTYGPNTHLNGHQTLAYARVRSIDSDFSRAERQRKVLSELAKKLKEKSLPELMALGASMMNQVSTNMDFDTIMSIAVKVLEGDLKSIDTFRVPVNDTYTLEVRNEEAMFYDVDWTTNQRELYTFIYD
ncbi:MAG: LCP family protein [Clostridia bacterium]|nr:LCP family protein [Clostridia bacterium]